jgi:hypothetical protein
MLRRHFGPIFGRQFHWMESTAHLGVNVGWMWLLLPALGIWALKDGACSPPEK